MACISDPQGYHHFWWTAVFSKCQDRVHKDRKSHVLNHTDRKVIFTRTSASSKVVMRAMECWKEALLFVFTFYRGDVQLGLVMICPLAASVH